MNPFRRRPNAASKLTPANVDKRDPTLIGAAPKTYQRRKSSNLYIGGYISRDQRPGKDEIIGRSAPVRFGGG
jgi:hypothetical protein